jgi:hypothetical protein
MRGYDDRLDRAAPRRPASARAARSSRTPVVGQAAAGVTAKMILEEKLAIRVHFFRQEKSFQDLFDMVVRDAEPTEFGMKEYGVCGVCGASGSTNF